MKEKELRISTDYEWVIEEIDENGEIWENRFADKLKDLLDYKTKKPEEGISQYQLGLLRRTGNEAEGELERGYAYEVDGKLAEEFDNGYRVPKHCLAEYKKVWKIQ